MPADNVQPLLQAVRAAASDAGVFGDVLIRDDTLVCHAPRSGAPASYRVLFDRGRPWVALVTADRWLSESIESDLMHTGDKLEELLLEELVDQGVSEQDARDLVIEHFRSDDLLFVFRTPVPRSTPDAVTRWLLAYEACFRNLGDMEAGSDDEH